MVTPTSQPLDVQLSGATAEFVRTQISAGHHSTAADVIDDLVLSLGDTVATVDTLDAALLDGITSGPRIEVTAAYWEAKRRAFLNRHQEKHGS